MTTEDDVRKLALALPEVMERSSYGTPGFRVADKLFARILDDPTVCLLFRSSIEDRDELVSSDPAKFFTTDHYRNHPSVLVRLPVVDARELAELLTEAWVVRAPRRLIDGWPSLSSGVRASRPRARDPVVLRLQR